MHFNQLWDAFKAKLFLALPFKTLITTIWRYISKKKLEQLKKQPRYEKQVDLDPKDDTDFNQSDSDINPDPKTSIADSTSAKDLWISKARDDFVQKKPFFTSMILERSSDLNSLLPDGDPEYLDRSAIVERSSQLTNFLPS